MMGYWCCCRINTLLPDPGPRRDWTFIAFISYPPLMFKVPTEGVAGEFGT